MPLDIVSTTDAISLWIKTCYTSEQVSLIGEVIEHFIEKRFGSIEPPYIITVAKRILYSQMDDQLTILANKKPGE